jgi:hypothetical protein
MIEISSIFFLLFTLAFKKIKNKKTTGIVVFLEIL